MNRRATRITIHSWIGWVLVSLLVACGGESPAPRPPPPPAPFQPQIVVVDLGAHGGKTTLVSTQGGGWTRHEAPFASGDTVEGVNGATYKLTLAEGGRWSAEFVAAEPVVVALGGSGDSVMIETREDGRHVLGDTPIRSGETRLFKNGNTYRFTLGPDDTWQAEFVPPDAVRVRLGSSGDTAELFVLENGTYSFRGEAVASGQVRKAANGNDYRFVKNESGQWEAVYVPPEPVTVRLGSSGGSVSLQRLEDGAYRLDGDPIRSGQTRTFDGVTYRFVLQLSGEWTAVFEAAEPVTVELGNSGNTVSVTILENRTYALGDEPLTNNQVRTINGNQYRFTLGPDGWRATYEAVRVTLQLGREGGSIELIRQEDSTYTLDGKVVDSDHVVTRNGRNYRLTHIGNRWIAEYDPSTVTVRIPDSTAVITLAIRENGEYEHNRTVVGNGSEITLEGSKYRLNLVNGRWSATFVSGEFTVALGSRGDFITLVRRPDGTVEHNGRRIRSGSVVRNTRTGTRYTLLLRSGVWSSRLYFPPSPGGGGGGSGGGSQTPTTTKDLEDALPKGFLRNSQKALKDQGDLLQHTQKDASGVDYSAYRGSGSFESETYVEAARRVLQDIVNKVKPRVGGDAGEKYAAQVVLETSWPTARAALSAIFNSKAGTPAGTVLLSALPGTTERIDEEDRLEDVEDLLAALESVADFKSAFGASGVFSGFSAAEANAEKIFNARKKSLAIGTTANTRFGAIAEPPQDTTAEEFAKGGSTLAVRSFAYSPLAPKSLSDFQTRDAVRGTSVYRGQTFAVRPADGALFSGTIELTASFGIERIDSSISNLTHTEDGDAWEYEDRDVSKIQLPAITFSQLADNGGFERSVSSKISIVGSQFDRDADIEFKGQFVGDTRAEVFGTWAVTDSNSAKVLDGAYGADRQSLSRVKMPTADSNGRSKEFTDAGKGSDLSGATALLISTGSLSTATRQFGLNDLYTRSSTTRTQTISGTGHTLAVRSRHTAYTRFGAWAHTTSAGAQGVGFFGYSSLAEATYDAARFPRNVTAEYVGRTVAVGKNGVLYDGDYVLKMDWTDTTRNLESKIENLRAVTGGARFTIGGTEVQTIAFLHDWSSAGLSQGSKLNFASPRSAGIHYTTNPESGVAPSSSTHTGHFLGVPSGVDGPHAVVGEWSVTEGSTTIEGAFGADLDPSP